MRSTCNYFFSVNALLLVLTGIILLLQPAPTLSSPFLPSARQSAFSLSFRGGAFFSPGKPSPPPASNFWDQLAAGAGEKFQEALETGVPTQLSYGLLAGYCSGMALKKVGQVAATVFGIGFVTLQTLSYYGYIEISHDKFKTTVENALDLNKDGKVDKSDMRQSFDRLMGVLTYNLPSGAGFVCGFMGGLRS